MRPPKMFKSHAHIPTYRHIDIHMYVRARIHAFHTCISYMHTHAHTYTHKHTYAQDRNHTYTHTHTYASLMSKVLDTENAHYL